MMFRRLVFTAGLAIMLSACGGKTPTDPATNAPGFGTQPNPPAPTQPPPTPLPTIPPETLTTDQVSQRLDPFGSPDCQLPCFNGLTPGDSKLPDALAFYARLGIGASDFVPGDFQHAATGTGNLRATLMRSTDITQALDAGFKPPETNAYLNDGKIQMVYVRYETYPASLAAARIISTLGAPDKVGLSLIYTTDPNTPTNFIIQMAYAAKQAGFSYLGSTTGDASAQQACLTDVGVRETVFGVFAAGFAPFSDNPAAPKILPLDESTGISAADFATAVTSNGCISIPADKWLQWRP